MAGVTDILSSLGGGTPWGAIAQGVGGLAQAIGGGIQAHRAQKQLEKLQSPTYTPNKSIMDYYNKALERYNTNPYQSQQYQYATQRADRNMAAGIGALNSRAAAVGGISRLAALSNDASLQAGVQAEQQQNQRFGQLGQAAGMKAGEDRTAFDYNQMQPFERKYNLLAAKAGGGNQIANAGLSNVFNGLQNVNDYMMVNKAYGDQGTGSGGGGGNNYQIRPNYSNYTSALPDIYPDENNYGDIH